MRRDILNSSLVGEPRDNVFPLNLLNLLLGVLLDEVINMHEATSDSHHDLIPLLNLDVNSLLPELINALRFPQKHDLHLFPLRVFVQVIAKSLIDLTILLCDVNSLVSLQSLIQI